MTKQKNVIINKRRKIKKLKNMKKMVLTAAAVFGFAVASVAADNNAVSTKVNVNTAKLSEYLDLSAAQYDNVEAINEHFESEMAAADNASDDKKAAKVRKAVLGNCKLMKEALSKEQYSKYLSVINATISNKGLNEMINE